MSPLTEFVLFCYKVFVELCELTVDVIAFPFLVAALLAPWRMPFLAYGMCAHPPGFKGLETRKNYRALAVSQCTLAVFEGVTYVALVLVALSGLRTAKLIEKVRKAGKWDAASQCNFTRLEDVWAQFFKLRALITRPLTRVRARTPAQAAVVHSRNSVSHRRQCAT